MISFHFFLLLKRLALRGDERRDFYIPWWLLQSKEGRELFQSDTGVKSALTLWLGKVLFIGYPAWVPVHIIEGQGAEFRVRGSRARFAVHEVAVEGAEVVVPLRECQLGKAEPDSGGRRNN
jgi:hypothetical protein